MSEGRAAVFSSVTRGSLTEIVTLNEHPKEVRGCHLGKSVPGGKNSVCKGPEAGTCLHSQGSLRKTDQRESHTKRRRGPKGNKGGLV